MPRSSQLPNRYYDMDHVRVADGAIYRLLGNFAPDENDIQTKFLGYRLYLPDKQGERLFRGAPYAKNYAEETTNPRDVLDTYEVLTVADVVEYFDPIRIAQERRPSYEGTVWAELYDSLVEAFGKDSVGIFGSALPGDGLHLNSQGTIRNDVDFFIEGVHNIPVLAKNLTQFREGLGFTDYTKASERDIIESWKAVFKNTNNSFGAIMQRRWSGMQLNDKGRIVLNTLRFRDRNVLMPARLLDADNVIGKNVKVEGNVGESAKGNLYPRLFTVEANGKEVPVYSFWWKLSSPVQKGDAVSLCGDLIDIGGRQVLRITNYKDHWIGIREP
jgi:hypothetical protein